MSESEGADPAPAQDRAAAPPDEPIEAAATAEGEAVPRLVMRDPDDRLTRLLRQGQLLLVKHPVATQAAIRALVAEGRRFAGTPDGAAWRRSLARSELVRRGRHVWEGLTLNMLEEDPATVLPSTMVDALFGAASRSDLESLLSRLFTDLPDEEPPTGRGEGDAGAP